MKKVRETFEHMDPVASVDVDFEAKTATVTTKPGKTLTRQAVEKAFAGSTYGVTKFDRVAAGDVGRVPSEASVQTPPLSRLARGTGSTTPGDRRDPDEHHHPATAQQMQ